MYNSFLVRLKADSDLIIKDTVKEIYNSIESLGDNIGYFTISSFLGCKKYNLNIEEGKKYIFKITTLDNDTFATITSNLFRKRITKDYLDIENGKFKVVDIILNDSNSKYIKIFTEKDLDYINSKECKRDMYDISILTPTIFKVGSKFYNKLDSEIIFRNLLSKFNKLSKYKIPKEFIENINDINIIENDIIYSKVGLNNIYKEGLQGDITIDLQNCDKYTKQIARTLIEFAVFSGIGYKYEYGYGSLYIK